MNVLGVYDGHDANAALINDTSIIAAAQEERFRRIKHFYGFPSESIKFVLRHAGLKPSDIKYVAYPSEASTLKDDPHSPFLIRNLHLLGIDHYKEIIPIDHHQAHVASAYRCCGWPKATVISLDGSGGNFSGTVCYGEEGKLYKISEIANQGSLGWFYSSVTEALGFRPNDEEGKTMGLAAYGRRNPYLIEKLKIFAPRINGLVLQRDTLWKISAKPVNGFYGCHFEDSHKIRRLVEKYGGENVAACAQAILEETTKELVKNAVKKTGCPYLAVAGGIFFNVKLNMELEQLACVKEIRPHPASGDSGLALGAALEAVSMRTTKRVVHNLTHAYFGPSFTNKEVMASIRKHKKGRLKMRKVDYAKIPSIVSEYLQNGFAVGWFQGRMEYGPRSLGARSVLLDPRNVEAKERLNNQLKRREWFMPFAPTILQEHAKDFIRRPKTIYSPFMIKAFRVNRAKTKDVAAATHVDGTIRTHILSRGQNPLYYDLIKEFYKRTGVPAVLNTSFNRHGAPIVCSPDDALEHLKMRCVDVLVINNLVIENIS